MVTSCVAAARSLFLCRVEREGMKCVVAGLEVVVAAVGSFVVVLSVVVVAGVAVAVVVR